MNNRKTELQTLARFCVTKSPGFAAIALWVPYRAVADDGFVAYTNGQEVVFGGKFWDYQPLERAFILCHEILHVALRHCQRGLKYARQSSAHAHIWNIACDAIINYSLDGLDWLQTPGDGVKFDKILEPQILENRPPASWSTEALYLQLLEQIGLPKDGKNMEQWLEKWMNERGIEGFDLMPGLGETSGDLSEDVASRIWSSRLTRAQAGDRPGGMMRRLASDFPVSKTPWPRILRAFLQDAVMPRSTENWSRPGRRMLATGSDVFEPATRPDKGIRRIAVAVDTSGSIDDGILRRFCAEIDAVQKRAGCEIYLVVADAEVTGEIMVKNDGRSFADKVRDGQIEFKGGGGTAFGPAIEKINESGAKVGLYLTDMYGDFGKVAPTMPFLWCSITPEMSAPFGKVIYLDPMDK